MKTHLYVISFCVFSHINSQTTYFRRCDATERDRERASKQNKFVNNVRNFMDARDLELSCGHFK